MKRTQIVGFVVAAVTLAPGSAAAQTYPLPEDVASPLAAVNAAYEAIGRQPGEDYDWERFRSLHLPDARLVPQAEQRGGSFDVLSVDGFIEWIDSATNVGGPDDQGFYEEGVHAVVHRYGDIAQVMSTYTKRFANSDEILGRGINAFTLVWDGNRWWILSIAWDEDNSAGPIPDTYLP